MIPVRLHLPEGQSLSISLPALPAAGTIFQLDETMFTVSLVTFLHKTTGSWGGQTEIAVHLVAP